jgi:prolyl 4-hydroxylase
MPLENCESLQVVKYLPGGFFSPHYDSTIDSSEASVEFRTHGGNRVLTILVSLNDPVDYFGGETVFTKLQKKYKLNKGSGILFYSLDPEGNLNDLSEHCGSEVYSGEKWMCNIWIRQSKFV